MITAKISTVQIGTLSIEGLLLEDGAFAIGIPQVARLFDVPQHNASRDFKALLGKGLTILKVKVEDSRVTLQSISLPKFELLVFELILKGNIGAIEFARTLVGLSLHQLFCDSFKIKFEAEDRQKWLKARSAGKESRLLFTDAIKGYLDAQPELSFNYKKWIYSNCSDRINRAVYNGMSTKQLRETRQDHYALLRDGHETPELRTIDHIEFNAAKWVKRGFEPMAATEGAIEFVMEYN